MPLRFLGAFTSISGVILLSILIGVTSQRDNKLLLTFVFLAIIILSFFDFGKARLIIWLMLLITIIMIPHPKLLYIKCYFNNLLGVKFDRISSSLNLSAPSWIYILTCLLLLFVNTASIQDIKSGSYWSYWKNDKFWSKINEENGTVLVASGMPLAQIIIGRQLTLWTEELGILPYAPQEGPFVVNALDKLYGIDLFNANETINCRLKHESE